MAKYDVKIPTVGESITEATIGSWNKQNGEAVKQNDVILQVETDKASVEVVAEQSGVLTISAQAGETVKIGATVGFIDSDAKASAGSAPKAEAPKSAPAAAPQAQASATSASGGGSKDHLSPAVQKIVTEKGIDPTSVQGTGKDGRLTKGDVMHHSTSAETHPTGPQPPPPGPIRKDAPAPVAIVPRGPSKQGDVKRVPMTTIRKKIAERLVQAQHNAAILTTFNEVDMSKAMEIRAKYKDKFKEKYGTNLGFMGIFVKAAIEALKDWPAVNSRIDGTDLIYHNFYNIGVAVGTEKGLIVPVIKDADQLSIAGVEQSIKNFALKARDGKISIDDLSGGTFTISNGGVYGSLMSTPILNAPQAGILGMHKIEERPIAINGKVEIRPMMYLALSYDHRIIDGKEAVSFLVRVKECIEDPERLVLEI